MSDTVRQQPIVIRLPRLKIIEDRGKFDLCALMTLLLLLLYSSDSASIRIPIVILCILAFLFNSLRDNAKFWFIVTATLFIGTLSEWYQIDNHKYLLGYWCLALFLSLLTKNPERSLATAARWMIGLVFFFAIFWKVTSDNYLSGSFFHFSLLIDERFKSLAQAVAGLTDKMDVVNQAAYRALVNYDSTLERVQFQSSPQLALLAQDITWWAFISELVVAVAFLWPEGRFVSRLRDFFLLVFIISTYSIAPVIGFGWLLVIMGIAQCTRRHQGIYLLYVFAFVALQLFRLPLNIDF